MSTVEEGIVGGLRIVRTVVPVPSREILSCLVFKDKVFPKRVISKRKVE